MIYFMRQGGQISYADVSNSAKQEPMMILPTVLDKIWNFQSFQQIEQKYTRNTSSVK